MTTGRLSCRSAAGGGNRITEVAAATVSAEPEPEVPAAFERAAVAEPQKRPLSVNATPEDQKERSLPRRNPRLPSVRRRSTGRGEPLPLRLREKARSRRLRTPPPKARSKPVPMTRNRKACTPDDGYGYEHGQTESIPAGDAKRLGQLSRRSRRFSALSCGCAYRSCVGCGGIIRFRTIAGIVGRRVFVVVIVTIVGQLVLNVVGDFLQRFGFPLQVGHFAIPSRLEFA